MAKPELKSKMTLDTRGFQRGLRKVRRLGRNFGRNFGAPIGQATGALTRLGVIAGTVAAAGILLAVKKVSQLGDEMDKMSKRTGISTEELSRLKFAAELSGTGIETLEKAVKRMSAVILDGEQGLKTATDSFDLLGIKMEDVSNKTPEQQLNVFLEALAGVENASSRAALAQELFGRAGTQLLPMLSDGVKGLQGMKEEADKFGIVITQEQAAGAAQFVDELSRVKASLTGLLLSAVKFDKINVLIRQMAESISEFRKSAKFAAITKSIADFARSTISFVVRVVRAWGSLDQDTRQALKRLGAGAATFIILWKSGFIGPFVTLLANLVAQVAIALPVIVTQFVVLQGGLAGAAKAIKRTMISLFKAMVVPLVAIGAFIAGMAIGDAIDRAFDLSGTLLGMKAQIKSFKDQLVAMWELSGKEQEDKIRQINKRLAKELAEIASVADAPAPDFLTGITDSIDKTLKDLTGLFDKIVIPGKESIKKIMAAWAKFKGIDLVNIDDAAAALGNMGAEGAKAGQALNVLNGIVRGFDIGKEAIIRQAGRLKTLGPAIGPATRDFLGLKAKGKKPPKPWRDVQRVPAPGGPPVRIPGLSPPGPIPPVDIDKITAPMKTSAALNKKQLKQAEKTNVNLQKILSQKRVLGWAE